MSGAPEHVEDVEKMSKKLWNASGLERKRSERRVNENSPEGAREEPEDPGGKTDVPGGSHTYQEGPRYQGNERVVETNASNPDGGLGGDMGAQEKSRVVEGNPDSANVVNRTKYNGIGPRNVRNERVVDTSTLRRDRRPGGHMGELASVRGVEGNWRRRNDGEWVRYDGRRGGKHGTTSGASHDSKRVGVRLLAGNKSGQNGKRKRAKTDVPGPSRPPPSHPRRSTEPVDPPRRRGRLKTRPKRIRRSKRRKLTYRVVQPRRGQSGRIERSGYVVSTVVYFGDYTIVFYRYVFSLLIQ